jgi:hypothetical protein
MLQWAKVLTTTARRQVVPCRAGVLTAIVYSNGDVGVCETHAPLGNLREKTFPEIWSSKAAVDLRASIARNECYCTNEVFLWPSIVYQPLQLIQALNGARIWHKTPPLAANGEGEPAYSRPAEGGLVHIDNTRNQ